MIKDLQSYQYKGPKATVCVVCSRKKNVATVVRVERARGRKVND